MTTYCWKSETASGHLSARDDKDAIRTVMKVAKREINYLQKQIEELKGHIRSCNPSNDCNDCQDYKKPWCGLTDFTLDSCEEEG